MAQIGPAALLLFLCLVVCTVYGANTTNTECQLLNATLSNSSNTGYKLVISPETLSSNTEYTVTLDGNGNVTVILQAVSVSSPVGNWSQGNIDCNGSPLFLNPFLSGTQIQAKWTSPQNLTDVTINAHIGNTAAKVLVSQTLSSAIVPPTNHTTQAPGSSKSTVNGSAAATTVINTTQQTVTQTTNAGSAKQSSLISVALIQIVCLLVIPSKYLS